MNRPLKFRVWDNELKKFGNPDQYGLILRYGLIHGKEKHPEYSIYYNPNVIIQQYTGLKDKNGKEIYEGDVLERNTSYYYKVEYCEKNAAYICRNCDGCFVYLSDFEYIIIGNLMEHPELLK